VEGRLIRRYKRFLADIQLPEGVVTAACPNTGSLMGCCEPGSRVWLSESDSASRKYRHTWEIVEVGKVMVGINTGLPNKLVSEAIVEGVIGELSGYDTVRREVRYGEEASRVDFVLGDRSALLRVVATPAGRLQWSHMLRSTFNVPGCNPLVDPLWSDARYRDAMRGLGMAPCAQARPWPLPLRPKA